MSRQAKRAEEREQEALDTTELNCKFTKRELTFIFNVLASRQDYRAGDGYIAFVLLQRLQPIVATASHDVPEEEEAKKEVQVSVEKEVN